MLFCWHLFNRCTSKQVWQTRANAMKLLVLLAALAVCKSQYEPHPRKKNSDECFIYFFFFVCFKVHFFDNWPGMLVNADICTIPKAFWRFWGPYVQNQMALCIPIFGWKTIKKTLLFYFGGMEAWQSASLCSGKVYELLVSGSNRLGKHNALLIIHHWYT